MCVSRGQKGDCKVINFNIISGEHCDMFDECIDYLIHGENTCNECENAINKILKTVL